MFRPMGGVSGGSLNRNIALWVYLQSYTIHFVDKEPQYYIEWPGVGDTIVLFRS
jgi:hypothetical protein